VWAGCTLLHAETNSLRSLRIICTTPTLSVIIYCFGDAKAVDADRAENLFYASTKLIRRYGSQVIRTRSSARICTYSLHANMRKAVWNTCSTKGRTKGIENEISGLSHVSSRLHPYSAIYFYHFEQHDTDFEPSLIRNLL
jgi:hypothetical protein